MANSKFTISQFYGVTRGIADNLAPLGSAAEARNVDLSDGALQTLIGYMKWPVTYDGGTGPQKADPKMLWRSAWGTYLYYDVYSNAVYEILRTDSSSNASAKGRVVLSIDPNSFPVMTAPKRLFTTTISGKPVAIFLDGIHQPALIGSGTNNALYCRAFGTGMFLTSDQISAVFTGTDSVIVGVSVNRVFSSEEAARCKYAGVYVMETESEQLDYTAAYVSEVRLFSDHTTIVFADALPSGSVEVGHYIKVRGGLSDKPVNVMAMHYGRLFAGGNLSVPNRLYWSCLPGDDRTIEDWSADDASPDTGGGYVQVGKVGARIKALFAYDQQLLIWCGDEIWRLYGASPSQYTLELVDVGYGQQTTSTNINSPLTYAFVYEKQESIANVRGVPYILTDQGFMYYDGNGFQPVSSERTMASLLLSGNNVRNWMGDLSQDLFTGRVSFHEGGLFFSVPGADDYVARYDLRTGTYITLYRPNTGFSASSGKMLFGAGSSDYPLEGFEVLLYGFNTEADVSALDTPSGATWENAYHYAGHRIDAVWESHDLSFGESSMNKRLRRIGMDVTGPIRVIIKFPDGTLFDQVYLTNTDRERRFLWIAVDMPYESSFRIRFESVSGRPFRVHNGIDFYLETNQRN